MLMSFLITGFLLAAPAENTNDTLIRQLRAEVGLLKAENARLRTELMKAGTRPKPATSQPTTKQAKSQQPPKSPMQLLADAERQRQISLAEDDMRAIVRRYKYSRQSPEDKILYDRGARECRANLKRLRNKAIAIRFPPLWYGKLYVGHVASSGSGQVMDIIDANNLLLGLGHNRIVWVSGLSTVGYTNGDTFSFDTTVRITGTKKYTTVSHSGNTVFVVEPVPFYDQP